MDKVKKMLFVYFFYSVELQKPELQQFCETPISGFAVNLTRAAVPLHRPHEVVGSLLAVQRLQQVKNVVVKHEVDQVEGA